MGNKEKFSSAGVFPEGKDRDDQIKSVHQRMETTKKKPGQTTRDKTEKKEGSLKRFTTTSSVLEWAKRKDSLGLNPFSLLL